LIVAWGSANFHGYSGEDPDYDAPVQIIDSLDYLAGGAPPAIGFAEMLAALTEGEQSAQLAAWAARVYERGTAAPPRIPDARETDPAELVEASVAGDEAAWNEIVRRYSPMVYGLARGFRLSEADANDVSQTVWLTLLEHLPQLREPRSLPRWIATTA